MELGRANTELIVGVDITTDYIRAVEIEKTGERYGIRNAGMVSTPEGAVEDGRIIDTKAVAGRLRQLFRERQFSTSRAVTAIRGNGVVSRIITLPSMPHERLRVIVEKEVNRYVLFNNLDKVVSYYPLEEYDEFERRKIAILLAVAQKSVAQPVYQTFKDAKLSLQLIDFSTFSILRELINSKPEAKDNNCLSLIIDHHGALMNIFNNGILHFSRQICPEDSTVDSEAFTERLISELLLAVQYYQTDFMRGGQIEKIIVTSSLLSGQDIFDSIRQNIEDIPVELHDPIAAYGIGSSSIPPEVADTINCEYATAIGLALHGQEIELPPYHIDFMPVEVAESRIFNEHIRLFMIALAVIILVYAGLVTKVRLDIKDLARQEKLLEISQQTNNNKLKNLQNRKSQVLERNPIATNRAITDNWLPLFELVKKDTPQKVQLNSMSIDPETSKVEFIGIADSNPSIFYFVSALKNSGQFSNVELGPRNVTDVFGAQMVSFVIYSDFRGQKD